MKMQTKNIITIATLILLPITALAVAFRQDVQIIGSGTIVGALSKGAGTFAIDHPLNPKNKLLFHSFVESPDVKNIYDGVAELDQNGEAIIELPSYFDALNTDARYQFFPHDEPMPNLHIREEVFENRFIISGGVSHGTISWQVTGIRKDPYILANPIITEVEKSSSTLVNKGEYISPEVYSDI